MEKNLALHNQWLRLLCPDCMAPLPMDDGNWSACPACGWLPRERAGVLVALPRKARDREIKERERQGWLLNALPPRDERDAFLLSLPFVEEESPTPTHYREAGRQFRVALEYLSPLRGKRGLDLGGKVGWAAYRFVQNGAEMVCVDYNDGPESGLEAGSAYATAGFPFDRICADAEALPLGDEQFDFVFSSAFLHHLPSPARAIAHVSRVLKPGGAYIACTEAFCPFWMRRHRALARCDLAMRFISEGINEQVFYMREYRKWFRQAGLKLSVINPRWDKVAPGKIALGRNLREPGFRPEILTNREHAAGMSGILARAVLASRLWQPLASPSLFPLVRGTLLNGTQKFRILVGVKGVVA
jgi:SAM-dependent methyltransferase